MEEEKECARKSENVDTFGSNKIGNNGSDKIEKDKENNITVFQNQKNPLELIPVIGCVLQFLNVADLKNCRYISKEWSSAALLELKRRSKIGFKRLWFWDDDFSFEHFKERTPTLFHDEISNTSLAIPFRAFGFYSGDFTGWNVTELNSFVQSHKNILHELYVKSLNVFDEDDRLLDSFDITSCISDSPMTRPNTNYSTKLSVCQSKLLDGKTEIMVPISSLIYIKKLEFDGCQIILNDKTKISPTELMLEGVKFIRDGHELDNVCVNEVFDFSRSKKIQINTTNYDDLMNTEPPLVSLDLSLNKSVVLDYLDLTNVKIMNWGGCKWTIKKLMLGRIPFIETTKMQVKDFLIYFSKIDISVLPKSIQRLVVYVDTETPCFCSQSVALPNLKFLHLRVGAQLPGIISHFVNCLIVELYLTGNDSDSDPLEINFDSIPKSVKNLKLNGVKVNIQVTDNALNLDKLVLENYPITFQDDNLKILTSSHFNTSELIIVDSDPDSEIQAHDADLVQLLHFDKKCLGRDQRFYIGPFKWNEHCTFENSQLVKYVAEKAACYVFNNGIGKPVDRGEFLKLAAVAREISSYR